MPWKKGQSGNPGGRPQDRHFRKALIAELRAAGDSMPELRQISRKIIDQALDGDLAAANVIWDRLEGKPMQSHEVTTMVDDPIPETREDKMRLYDELCDRLGITEVPKPTAASTSRRQ